MPSTYAETEVIEDPMSHANCMAFAMCTMQNYKDSFVFYLWWHPDRLLVNFWEPLKIPERELVPITMYVNFKEY